MTIKLGVVMDPIADINYKKDTTMAMLRPDYRALGA